MQERWETHGALGGFVSGRVRFVYDDTLFRPGTDTFLLSSLPRLKRGLPGCATWDAARGY